jgi:hypothetical protein
MITTETRLGSDRLGSDPSRFGRPSSERSYRMRRQRQRRGHSSDRLGSDPSRFGSPSSAARAQIGSAQIGSGIGSGIGSEIRLAQITSAAGMAVLAAWLCSARLQLA